MNCSSIHYIHIHSHFLGAVPIPDPQIEKAKVVKPYSLDSHHYDQDKPAFHEIKPGHFVWANNAEIS